MAVAVRIVTNPADTDQKYILWDNGKVSAFGGAPPMTGIPQWFNFSGPDAPARALVVIDWTTPAGYIMDYYGQVYPFGGATLPSGPAAPSSSPFRVGVDLVMDPAGNGAGYSLWSTGTVNAFGGAPAVAAGATFPGGTGKRLVMQWSSKKYYILEGQGGVYPRNGAHAITSGPAWPGYDIARALSIYDWTNGKGWLLNGWGEVWSINGAQAATGHPYWPGQDIARDLNVIDDGTGDSPLEQVILDALGTRHQYISSTAPTITVSTPTGTVTNTTRPAVTWAYSDAQGDAQYRYQVGIYDSAAYSVGGFDPFADDTYLNSVAKWRGFAIAKNIRQVIPDKDLAAGTYRAYVRVQDTSKLWSAAAYSQFVLAPVASSVPTVVAAFTGRGIQLTISHSSPHAGDRYAVVYVDANGDSDFVRRGAKLPADTGSATVTDYEAPLGEVRSYYAVSYQSDPYLASAPSALVASKMPIREWWLTCCGAVNQGGKFSVKEPFSFARTAVAGVFRPAGRKFPVVISDGVLKGAAVPLTIQVLTKADYDRLEAVLTADDDLQLRDIYGRSWYCRIAAGDVVHSLLRAAKDGLNDYPLRHSHDVTIPLVEIDRPAVNLPTIFSTVDPITDFYG